MKATEMLANEHRLMLKALDTFTLAKKRLENGEHPEALFFKKAVEFSKTFSDKFHHFKEEFLLFGLLAQKKDGALDLEMGALRYQHERNRFFLKNIEQSIDGYDLNNDNAYNSRWNRSHCYAVCSAHDQQYTRKPAISAVLGVVAVRKNQRFPINYIERG